MLLLVNFTTLRRLPLLWWASRITTQKPNSTLGYSPYLHDTCSFKLSLPICESARQPQFSEWVPACNDETVTKAHRFSISISTVSRIFHKWLDVMYTRVVKYIRWPDRETLSKNSSCCLSKTLSTSLMHNWLLWNIYREANFIQTYSNYRKHSIVEFVVGIILTGVICFLSLCWGGRVSDEKLTRCSGLLNLIEPGDVILADRGFHIAHDVAIQEAKRVISEANSSYLSMYEVKLSWQMAHVHIHVEWVVGVLKNRYTISQSISCQFLW